MGCEVDELQPAVLSLVMQVKLELETIHQKMEWLELVEGLARLNFLGKVWWVELGQMLGLELQELTMEELESELEPGLQLDHHRQSQPQRQQADLGQIQDYATRSRQCS